MGKAPEKTTQKRIQIGLVTLAMKKSSLAIAARSVALAAGFSQAGFEVHLIGARDLISQEYSVSRAWFRAPSNQSGLKRRLTSEILLGLSWFFIVLFSRKRDYVITSPPFFSSLLVSWAVRWRGGRYAFDVRDLYPSVFFHSGVLREDSKLGRFGRWLETSLYRNASCISTVTQPCQEAIEKSLDNPAVPIFLVPNGYSNAIGRLREKQVKSEAHMPFCLGYVGSLARMRDTALMIELFQHTADFFGNKVRFLVVGDGFGAPLLEQAKLPNFKWLRSVPHETIGRYLLQMDLGLYLNPDEATAYTKACFATKVFEYIGIGIPSLISNGGEDARSVEALKLGKVVDNQIEPLFEVVQEMIENPEAYQALKARVLECAPGFGRVLAATAFGKILYQAWALDHMPSPDIQKDAKPIGGPHD